MPFLKVTARLCNHYAEIREPEAAPRQFWLNVDMISAIEGDKVMPKDGEILRLGGHSFTEVLLVPGQEMG